MENMENTGVVIMEGEVVGMEGEGAVNMLPGPVKFD